MTCDMYSRGDIACTQQLSLRLFCIKGCGLQVVVTLAGLSCSTAQQAGADSDSHAYIAVQQAGHAVTRQCISSTPHSEAGRQQGRARCRCGMCHSRHARRAVHSCTLLPPLHGLRPPWSLPGAHVCIHSWLQRSCSASCRPAALQGAHRLAQLAAIEGHAGGGCVAALVFRAPQELVGHLCLRRRPTSPAEWHSEA